MSRTGLRVLGIDPGLTGAMAFLNADGSLEELEDLPTLGKILNSHLLSRLIQGYGPIKSAIVEQAQSMPRQGIAGAFNYGVNYGIIIGVLATLEVPTSFVTASVWKRKVHLTTDKTLSRRRASERWPARADDFKRVKDDGRAEAALLAAWWMSEQATTAKTKRPGAPVVP